MDEESFRILDGIICIGKFQESQIIRFEEINQNFILVDMYSKKITHNCVVLDFRGAMVQVMDYLVSLGHRKIGFLEGKEYLTVDTIYQEQRIVFVKHKPLLCSIFSASFLTP